MFLISNISEYITVKSRKTLQSFYWLLLFYCGEYVHNIFSNEYMQCHYMEIAETYSGDYIK